MSGCLQDTEIPEQRKRHGCAYKHNTQQPCPGARGAHRQTLRLLGAGLAQGLSDDSRHKEDNPRVAGRVYAVLWLGIPGE